MDIGLVPKIPKHHSFKDISISCQWVTYIGLKPPPNFFFEKISKNKATSSILSFKWFGLKIHFKMQLGPQNLVSS